jgi:hypothetical protein
MLRTTKQPFTPWILRLLVEASNHTAKERLKDAMLLLLRPSNYAVKLHIVELVTITIISTLSTFYMCFFHLVLS